MLKQMSILKKNLLSQDLMFLCSYFVVLIFVSYFIFKYTRDKVLWWLLFAMPHSDFLLVS